MALEKLSKKKGDIDKKLYKGEMCSLLLVFYGQYMDEDKTKKAELLLTLCMRRFKEPLCSAVLKFKSF